MTCIALIESKDISHIPFVKELPRTTLMLMQIILHFQIELFQYQKVTW